MPARPPRIAPTSASRATAIAVITPAVVRSPSLTGIRGKPLRLASRLNCVPATAPEDGDDDGDDHRPQPDPEALLGAGEPGHPAGDVAAGEVADKMITSSTSAADQADGLALAGVGVGRVDVGGQPEAGAGGGEQRGQQHRHAGGGQPAEEAGTELHAAEALLLPGHHLLAAERVSSAAGAAVGRRCRRSAVGVGPVVVR